MIDGRPVYSVSRPGALEAAVRANLEEIALFRATAEELQRAAQLDAARGQIPWWRYDPYSPIGRLVLLVPVLGPILISSASHVGYELLGPAGAVLEAFQRFVQLATELGIPSTLDGMTSGP